MRCVSWARELGLPEYLVMRQPFPGPGLAIRVIGDYHQGQGWTILRDADAIFREEIAAGRSGYRNISQYFAVLTDTAVGGRHGRRPDL